jgi:chromosome condensin MukBEF complex kleisin-like MukF subunit
MEFLPRDIVRECAIRGLSVRADALRNLQNFALEYSGDALHALIDAIVARLEHCTIRVVDTAIVSQALADVSKTNHGVATPSIECIDAWLLPQLTYDATTRTCVRPLIVVDSV